MINAIKVLINKSKDIRDNYDFIMNEIYSLEREYVKLYSEFKKNDVVLFNKDGEEIICKVIEIYFDLEEENGMIYVITNIENNNKTHYIHKNLFKTGSKSLKRCE